MFAHLPAKIVYFINGNLPETYFVLKTQTVGKTCFYTNGYSLIY